MYSLIKMPLTHLHPPSLSSLFHPPPHTCICTWFLLSLQKDAVVFFFVLHAWINGYQYSFFIQIMPTRDREAEKVRKEKCGLKNKKQQQKNNKSKTGCNKLQLEKAEAQKKEWEYFKEALNKRSDASLQQTVFCTHIVPLGSTNEDHSSRVLGCRGGYSQTYISTRDMGAVPCRHRLEQDAKCHEE